MIHISGTLINALQWIDNTVIELIKIGIKNNQFELVGSTYAQNVMYSCDDWDNDIQISLHRDLLEYLFEVKPVTFWNPERCWRQDLAKILVKNGYKYSFIEDHILIDSGIDPQIDYIFTEGLILFNDRKEFLHLTNEAIYSSNFNEVLSFIKKQKNIVLNYAEDAEIFGLWEYEGQQNFSLHSDPRKYWNNLDNFLNKLEEDPEIEITTFSNLVNHIPFSIEIPSLKDGQATWMVRAIENPKLMYHESGFKDWFDFNKQSIDLKVFRKIFEHLRDALKILETQINRKGLEPKIVPIAEKLFKHAKLIFSIHQYEFGCIGVVRIGDLQWEGVKFTSTLIYATQIALIYPKTGLFITDLYKEEIPQMFFISNYQLYVLSPIGGKIMYWFDLTTGNELVGNECPSFFKCKQEYYLPTLEINIPKIKSTIKHKKVKFRFGRQTLNDLIFIDQELLTDVKLVNQDIISGKVENQLSLQNVDILPEKKYSYKFYRNHSLSFEYSNKD